MEDIKMCDACLSCEHMQACVESEKKARNIIKETALHDGRAEEIPILEERMKGMRMGQICWPKLLGYYT